MEIKVTKELLSSYRNNRREIQELEFMLNNRWKSEAMISVDTIMDYRKGYPIPMGIAGFDEKRYERLQNIDLRRKMRKEEECRAVEEFIAAIEGEERLLFQMYYMEGEVKPPQREIAKKMHMDRSSISKKINAYLKHSHISQ